MSMVGIHDRPGSFSDRWIPYCREKNIPFRLVNCLASDVITQCKGLTAVLWHWNLDDPNALLVATQVITALESRNIDVFPSSATCAHYDDKIAQKYLLEAIDAPLIPTWVFLDRHTALEWIQRTSFPKVFKLRRGAGSSNVRLVRSSREARTLCRRAFGRGFRSSAGYFSDAGTKLRGAKRRGNIWDKVRRAPRSLLKSLNLRRQLPRQRGYLYFQEYLPDNRWDTRITIVGNRAFGFRRMNRPNDFRASGSGDLAYEPDRIDLRAVQIAFEVTRSLGAQSLAFDFLMNQHADPMIGEISYCYIAEVVHRCPGYWTESLEWCEGHVWPQDVILQDLLAKHAE